MDDSRTAEPDQHAAVRAMIPVVEGKPVVHVRGPDGMVCVCRRISGLHLAPEAFPDELCLYGMCEWADPPELRPDELTDGMVIGCGDGLRLGPGWWHDTYFDWYFVYDPALVARSLAGDHSWGPAFLAAAPPLPKPPVPDLRGRAHRLWPPDGCPYLHTEEVVNRLRGGFAFCEAYPHPGPIGLGAKVAELVARGARPSDIDAAVAGQDCTFSVVISDEAGTTDYLNFEVRPGEIILVVYRDEQHQSAAGSLAERCARLLAYEVSLL